MAQPAESIEAHSELSDLVAVWIKYSNDSWTVRGDGSDFLESRTPIEWAAYDARGVLRRTLEYFGQTLTEAQMSPGTDLQDLVWNPIPKNRQRFFGKLDPAAAFGLLRFGVDDIDRAG